MERSEHDERYLSSEEEALLLRIARDALTAWVGERKHIDLEAYPLTTALRERHGAFVTLHAGDELRGCIGYTANQTPLAETVRDNALNAASRDHRFQPVEPHELPHITIEISALCPGDTPDTPFKRVHDVGEILIGRDGLYIERAGDRGGLLLPQVASERNWDVPRFLEAVCQKAGYPTNAWQDPAYRLYRFSAQVFFESDRGHE